MTDVDRPIQAGDWVEWRNASYSVKLVVDELLQLVGVDGWWRVARFKRVDGPHPEKVCDHIFSNSEECCVYCHKPRSECYEEQDSSAPVGTGNAQSSGMGEKCRSCSSGIALPKHDYCVYCSNRFEKDGGAFSFDDDDSTALLAGLRAEKPRVTNRAEAAELAKPHPWEMQDD
jgi:hypothetical protein